VCDFVDGAWKIFESKRSWGDERIEKPRDAIALAVRIGTNRYSFWNIPADDVYQQIATAYDVFGWGKVPLSQTQSAHVLGLSKETMDILAQIPSAGKQSIPRLVVIALVVGRTLSEIGREMSHLAPLNIQQPDDRDEYIGVSWSELVADVESNDEK
jgi:hypothetical protein